jgi:hypothetical protein
MDRRRKVELFEEIRREYRFGVGTIQGVAKKLNTHRRMVRQALASAIPPERKVPAKRTKRTFPQGSDRDVPLTDGHHSVSPNSQIPANRLNPLHFLVSRSNDTHSIIAIDS